MDQLPGVLHKNLLDALYFRPTSDSASEIFAYGDKIVLYNEQHANFLLKWFDVEVKDMDGERSHRCYLPLSTHDSTLLINHVCERAPIGNGTTRKVVDTLMRRTWQIDAEKVKFPARSDFLCVVQEIADKALLAWGMDGPHDDMEVEAHLYKIFLNEGYGHSKNQCDIVKEPGMFATLVIQLPTAQGYVGGASVCRRGGAQKIFDFSGPDSSTGFFYKVSVVDCEHELHVVSEGIRMCVAFNLVRQTNCCNQTKPRQLNGYSQILEKTSDALLPWMKSTQTGGSHQHDCKAPEKLLLPLHHLKNQDILFSDLTGDDRIVANIFMDCKELDVKLCTLIQTQYVIASTATTRTASCGRKFSSCVKEQFSRVRPDVVEASNWRTTDDEQLYNFSPPINPHQEMVRYDSEVWPQLPATNAIVGNKSRTMEFKYPRAVLVICPKRKLHLIAAQRRIVDAIDVLESIREETNPNDTCLMLRELLTYCENGSEEVLNNFGPDTRYDPSSGLIEFCVAVGELQDVRRVLNLLSRTYLRYDTGKARPWHIGLQSPETAIAIASALRKYGWNTLQFEITSLLEQHLRVGQEYNFAHLMFDLQDLGFHDAISLIHRRFNAWGVEYDRVAGFVNMLRHKYSMQCGTSSFSREEYPS